jgi:hypothetical protein
LLGKRRQRVTTRKKDAEPSTVTPTEKDLTRSFVPKAPYPERMRVPKKNAQFAEILEVFK